MNKAELAQYLVNLHILLQAQTANVHPASKTLADEYDRVWLQLKEAINEARPSADEPDGLNEDRTQIEGDQSRGGKPAGTGTIPRDGI